MSDTGEQKLYDGFPDGDVAPQEALHEPIDPNAFAGIPGSPPVTDKGASTAALRPRKLSHRLKYVAQLASMGLTQKEICERTGYTQHRMSVILNAPIVSNEVERTRRHVFERDPEKALRTMLPKALESIDAVLDHKSDGFREKVEKSKTAFALLERTHGKPKQSMEMTGNLLADLYSMMDARVRDENAPTFHAEARDVSDAEVSPHEEAVKVVEDPLDAYLQHNLPAVVKESK